MQTKRDTEIIAERIRNLAHLTDAELAKRALDAELMSGGSFGDRLAAQAAAVSANIYRDELRRRQALAAAAA